MNGESVMRCYISTGIALTACLRKRLTLLGLQITISSSRKRPSRDQTDKVNRTEPGSSGPVQLPKYRQHVQVHASCWGLKTNILA